MLDREPHFSLNMMVMSVPTPIPLYWTFLMTGKLHFSPRITELTRVKPSYISGFVMYLSFSTTINRLRKIRTSFECQSAHCQTCLRNLKSILSYQSLNTCCWTLDHPRTLPQRNGCNKLDGVPYKQFSSQTTFNRSDSLGTPFRLRLASA